MIECGKEGCGAYERKELALYVTEKLKESWYSKGKSARMREWCPLRLSEEMVVSKHRSEGRQLVNKSAGQVENLYNQFFRNRSPV